jgi:hypothetical protein
VFNIHPAEPIILTSELDIKQLAKASGISIEHLIINMIGLGGLEVAPWSSQAGLSSLIMFMENSLIEFYVNGTKASDLKCSRDILIPFYSPQQLGSGKDNQNSSLFTVFTYIEFPYYSIYPTEPICP